MVQRRAQVAAALFQLDLQLRQVEGVFGGGGGLAPLRQVAQQRVEEVQSLRRAVGAEDHREYIDVVVHVGRSAKERRGGADIEVQPWHRGKAD